MVLSSALRRSSLVLVLVGACSGVGLVPEGTPEPAAGGAPARDGSAANEGPASGEPAAGVAVLRLEQVADECNGLGGVHAIFAVESLAAGAGVTRAHFGGHGVRGLTEADLGRIFVGEVIPRPATYSLPAGVCVELGPFDGLAGALGPAVDLPQARALAAARVRELRASGWTGGDLPPSCAVATAPSEPLRRRCATRWHAPWP